MIQFTQEFYATKGDAAAYVEIFMKYYESSIPVKSKIVGRTEAIAAQIKPIKDACSPNSELRAAIAVELENSDFVKYVKQIDHGKGLSDLLAHALNEKLLLCQISKPS